MFTWLMFIWPDAIDNPLNSLTALAVQLQTLVTNAIDHPIWAIALVILAIGLVQIIADLIKRLLKATLTFVLKLPINLSQWVWKRATTLPSPQTSSQANSQTEHVEQLIAKLEALREEQDQVVSELKTVLSQTKPTPVKRVAEKKPALEE